MNTCISYDELIVTNKAAKGRKGAIEALQDMRITYRWQAIDDEDKQIELAKEVNKAYKPLILENGDTHKQLLVRSRYLLFKNENKWTPTQSLRAETLFKYYPNLEPAYKLTRHLKGICEKTKDKTMALTRLARWYKK